jgi:hypothetical protein
MDHGMLLANCNDKSGGNNTPGKQVKKRHLDVLDNINKSWDHHLCQRMGMSASGCHGPSPPRLGGTTLELDGIPRR